MRGKRGQDGNEMEKKGKGKRASRKVMGGREGEETS